MKHFLHARIYLSSIITSQIGLNDVRPINLENQYKSFFFFSLGAPEVTFTGKQQASLNETVEFRCIVEANPAPVVKWLKNGVEFEPFPRENPVNNATFVRKEDAYRIQAAKPSDMAVYTCEATNKVLGKDKVVKKTIDFKVFCK